MGVDALRDRLAAATSRAEVAALRRGALVGEQELRARTAKKIAELTAVRDESQGAKQTAQTAVEAATVRVEQAERARVEAGAALTRARSRVEAAELGAELAAKRADLAAALDRLQRVEKAQRAQGERLAALAANTVDAQVLAVAVQLRASLLGVEARLTAVATSMRVIALGDHPVTVNGAEVGAGEISVVDDIVLEVPGSETAASESQEALLRDLPVELTAEVGRLRMTARELVELSPGAVLPLGRPLAGPVELVVGGKVVAIGELVDIEGELGVRLVQLTP